LLTATQQQTQGHFVCRSCT